MGVSYYVVATSLIGLVGDYLFDDRKQQDRASTNQLAEELAPLYLAAQTQALQERLEAAVQAGLSPENQVGKEICALHRRWLTITGNQYDPARHRGIAELYVIDERFTAYYDKQVPGCARFLRDAVVHWVK